MRFLSFTSFSSLIKEIKRCERKKPQAEGSLHFTIVELLEELDQRTKELQQETTRRYRSVHLAVVVSSVSEDFLCQARVSVAIL